MSILAFILFLLFLAVFIVPMALYAKARRWMNGVRQQYYDTRQGSAGHQLNNQHNPQQHRRKKKIFSRNEGEYVEFEEIQVTRSTSTSSEEVHYEREEQVSDAEWTEIR